MVLYLFKNIISYVIIKNTRGDFMFSNLIKKLENEHVDYDLTGNSIGFEIMLCDSEIQCEFSYDEENNAIRFYTELMDFNGEAFKDGLDLANSINYNSIFLKAYLDDEYYLCAEYYIIGKNNLTNEVIDNILADLADMAELISEYI